MYSKTMTMQATPNRVAMLVAWALMALSLLVMTGLQARASEAPLETAMDAVFTVRSNDADDRFLGSAFLWGEDGQVAVTNAHVVGDAEEVRLVDRLGHEDVGRVIALDSLRDVAVIALPSAQKGARRGLVAAPEPAGLGLEVYALGAPLGIEFTLTKGMISATARQVDIAVPLMMLQHDAAVNPGSSGGPLVDAKGQLIGMNSQIADGSRMFVGIAYAISAADLDRIVTGLIDETLAPFPPLGLKARPVDRQVAEALGGKAAGLLIDGVEAGGLAEAAGLQAGDIILAVDGTELTEPGAFAFAIEAALATGEAELAILRGKEAALVAMSFAAEEDKATMGIGIKTRDLTAMPSAPARIASYRLAALGVVLGENGLVTDVTDNSPAIFAGLIKGDSILAVDGAAMDKAALETLEITQPVLVLVRAPDGTTRHIYLDPWGGSDGVRPVGGANVLDPDVVVF